MEHSHTTQERGASMVEYALLVALVAVLSIPAIAMAGHETEKTMTTVAEALAGDDANGPVSGAPGDTHDSSDPGNDPSGDTPNPGNGDDDPGHDDQNPGNGNGTPGDDPNPGTSDDDGDDDDDDTFADDSVTESVTVGDPTSEIVDRKGNSQTYDWKATLPLVNDRDVAITFQVVIIEIDHNGKRTASRTRTITLQPGETLLLEHVTKVQFNSGSPKQTVAVAFEFDTVSAADGTSLPVPAPVVVEHPAVP